MKRCKDCSKIQKKVTRYQRYDGDEGKVVIYIKTCTGDFLTKHEYPMAKCNYKTRMAELELKKKQEELRKKKKKK